MSLGRMCKYISMDSSCGFTELYLNGSIVYQILLLMIQLYTARMLQNSFGSNLISEGEIQCPVET